MIKLVLISVFEKSGLEGFVKSLQKYGVKIISSGGTAEKVRSLGYPVIEVADYTGFPEMPGGLVKTLHPKIHGGILLDPSNPLHRECMREQGIEKIDMVVVNFYSLPSAESLVNIGLQEFGEDIDIGGPALVRAAAKAALLYETPIVVTDIDQYSLVIGELERNKGEVSRETRRMLALKAFEKTRSYDETIVSQLSTILGEARIGDR